MHMSFMYLGSPRIFSLRPLALLSLRVWKSVHINVHCIIGPSQTNVDHSPLRLQLEPFDFVLIRLEAEQALTFTAEDR